MYKYTFSNGVAWITRYFFYRVSNGITEIKQADSKFDNWTVGTIPKNAILIT